MADARTSAQDNIRMEAPRHNEGDEPTNAPDKETMHSRWRYFTIVLAAFMINFTACGILFSFGVYQALYESLATQPDTPFTGASTADLDLIGTLAASLMTICAPFVISAVKTYKPQPVIYCGSLLFALANVLASFGKRTWHFQLSQGLLLGIATGMTLLPSLIIPPAWFGRRRGLAMGIISGGTGIGGLVWAPAITAAIDHLGFRNTLRLTGSLGAVLLFLSGIMLDWEPSMAESLRLQKRGHSAVRNLFLIPHPSRETLLQRKFAAQALATVFQSATYYVPVFFTVAYSQTLGYTNKQGANLTAVGNACNAVGKIMTGFLADRIGRVNAFFLITVISALSVLGLWLPSTLTSANEQSARGLFIAFTVLYNLSASAFVSLFSAVLAELFGLQELPRIAGVMYLLQGAAALVGTPVAGLLVGQYGTETTSEDYVNVAAFVGALLLAATLAIAWLRIELCIGKKHCRWTVDK